LSILKWWADVNPEDPLCILEFDVELPLLLPVETGFIPANLPFETSVLSSSPSEAIEIQPAASFPDELPTVPDSRLCPDLRDASGLTFDE